MLFSMLEYQSANRVSVFLSMPTGEISTDGIVRRAIHDGKHVFVPYLYKTSEGGKPRSIMDMVALHSEMDYDALKPDRWGIPSIDAPSVGERKRCLGDADMSSHSTVAAVENPLDLVIVPGVAFDQNLQRLGHGKGFYDSFFSYYLSRAQSRSKMPHLGNTSTYSGGFR